MKKNGLLLLTILFLTACNNIEKSRNAILTASSERDTAVEGIRDLGRNIAGELERWSYYQSEIVKGQDNLPALSGEDQAKLNTLLGDFSGYNAKFSVFFQEVGAFAKVFDTQKPQMDAMKEALLGKKSYEGNINRTLTEMQKTNETAKEKVKAWEERLSKMGQEIEAKYKEIAALQGRPIE